MERTRITAIIGPTAVGKSSLAVDLAERFAGEIISADSMQVYRHMDIGTDKPPAELRRRVPHHLIDVVEPDDEYTAARFRGDASRVIEEVTGRGKRPFVVGGTGLYVKVLTEGLVDAPEGDPALRERLVQEAASRGREYLYERLERVDPETASGVHPNNLKRVIRALEVYELEGRPASELRREHAFGERPYGALKIGLYREREEIYRDIEARVDEMVARGLAAETRGLLDRGYSPDLKPMCGLGYKEMVGYLQGDYPLEEAVRLIKRNTRRYAKRQLTWFRKDRETRWYRPEEKEKIAEVVAAHFGC